MFIILVPYIEYVNGKLTGINIRIITNAKHENIILAWYLKIPRVLFKIKCKYPVNMMLAKKQVTKGPKDTWNIYSHSNSFFFSSNTFSSFKIESKSFISSTYRANKSAFLNTDFIPRSTSLVTSSRFNSGR